MELQTLLLALVCICFLHGDEHSTGCRADEGLQDYVPLYPLTCPINTHASFEKELLAGFTGSLLSWNPGTRSPMESLWRPRGNAKIRSHQGATRESF